MSKSPIYIKVEKNIHAPLSEVWDVVAVQFGNVAGYNPEIKASKFDSDKRGCVGTCRHCDFPGGGYIKEEVVEWNEQKSFDLKMIQSSVPMAVLKSRFVFENTGGIVHLTQEFWYRMKPPMGWLSGLMKGKMRKTLERGLSGLEQYLQKNK